MVYESLTAMNTIKPELCIPGTRLPGCFGAFEIAIRAILGQQISVKAASTISGRLVAAFGTAFETGIEGLTHTFPTPHMITALDGDITEHFGPLGITGARAKTILHLAQKFVAGELDFSLCVQAEAEIEKLMAIPGIGPWTAQYIAMRAMAWPDAFPHTDHGVKKALEPLSEKAILELAEEWRPWRSYATINLWNSLNK